MNLDESKIVVIDNKELNIYNYKDIGLIDSVNMVIDKYSIKGENLKITELDGYQIKIIGLVKEIIFKYE